MKNKTTIVLLLLTSFVFLLLNLSGCRPQRSATEKRYDLEGKVVAVEKDKQVVTVAHEDIKDVMPAMTMPFTVPAAWVYEVPLVPGDHITATLVVDGLKMWLEDVVITKENSESTSPGGAARVEPKPGEDVPDYRLVNQDDKAIRIKDYRGKALLLTFIFTRCQMPDQCTLMSNNFAAIDQELQKQPELREKTHLLSISFDPDYDTPKVLRSYGAAYTGKYSDETFAHWEFASGSTDEVKGIAQFFGLRYNKDSESGEEQLIHALRTALIGPDGKIVKVYRGNEWKPDEVLKEIQTLFPAKE
ncbi:MAG: SCO family protein [Pyrinomonadaceae bacterium]|nr:SCO family protein [Pyrinomonadaceae bacterium]